jgi:hypothetical protein
MIPFPKVHIAQSVLNRIMNTLEETGPLSMPVAQPIIPDPTAEGLGIDAAVQTPAAPAAALPGNEETSEAGMVESSLNGGSPFSGALLGNIPI